MKSKKIDLLENEKVANITLNLVDFLAQFSFKEATELAKDITHIMLNDMCDNCGEWRDTCECEPHDYNPYDDGADYEY